MGGGGGATSSAATAGAREREGERARGGLRPQFTSLNRLSPRPSAAASCCLLHKQQQQKKSAKSLVGSITSTRRFPE